MSLKFLVEDIGREMKGHWGQKSHLFGSPGPASPGQHVRLCVDQSTTEEDVVRTR